MTDNLLRRVQLSKLTIDSSAYRLWVNDTKRQLNSLGFLDLLLGKAAQLVLPENLNEAQRTAHECTLQRWNVHNDALHFALLDAIPLFVKVETNALPNASDVWATLERMYKLVHSNSFL